MPFRVIDEIHPVIRRSGQGHRADASPAEQAYAERVRLARRKNRFWVLAAFAPGLVYVVPLLVTKKSILAGLGRGVEDLVCAGLLIWMFGLMAWADRKVSRDAESGARLEEDTAKGLPPLMPGAT